MSNEESEWRIRNCFSIVQPNLRPKISPLLNMCGLGEVNLVAQVSMREHSTRRDEEQQRWRASEEAVLKTIKWPE